MNELSYQDLLLKLRSYKDQLYTIEKEYLELRDAKSNGCCYGMPIAQVLKYDAKIEDKAQELVVLLSAEADVLKELRKRKI